jgi:hypothetical protein
MIFCALSTQKCQGIAKDARAVLTYAWSYTQKSFFGPPSAPAENWDFIPWFPGAKR